MAPDAPTKSADRADTVAVILAGGSGSRFHGDRHKLLAELDGRPLADHAIRAALEAAIGPVVVVTGAERLDSLDPELLTHVWREHNAAWADGQRTSIQVGFAIADQRFDAEAIVVGLADQPFVTPQAWRAVAESRSPIAIATYGGARRNPVRLHRTVWPLLTGAGDIGARDLARLRPDLVEEVPCSGSAADIDTREDLRAWQNRSSTNSP